MLDTHQQWLGLWQNEKSNEICFILECNFELAHTCVVLILSQ